MKLNRTLILAAAALIVSACATQADYEAWEKDQAKSRVQVSLVEEGCGAIQATQFRDGGGSTRRPMMRKSSCTPDYSVQLDQQVFVTLYDAANQELLGALPELKDNHFVLALGKLEAGYKIKVGGESYTIE